MSLKVFSLNTPETLLSTFHEVQAEHSLKQLHSSLTLTSAKGPLFSFLLPHTLKTSSFFLNIPPAQSSNTFRIHISVPSTF